MPYIIVLVVTLLLVAGSVLFVRTPPPRKQATRREVSRLSNACHRLLWEKQTESLMMAAIRTPNPALRFRQ